MRIMAMAGTRLAIELDAFSQFFDAMVIQVGEEIGTDLSCAREGFRISRRGDPGGECGLYWCWIGAYLNELAVSTFDLYCFATPQLLHRLDATIHLFAAVSVALREEHKVVGVPARGEREA